ncbi:hypothetical protein JAAARDRAFT_669501 [Jaapia argillacea MUCL 33604]|uniref:Uncharacterized protein n=1 Tax=Jaapia argillacea MUCL 33604 TaxID=933084 RepID=A0A067Q4R5_9AGAM|nr:hypothetical protein JAAARDRAFT_669501 [Jaapia argillacea MUCL 33604]
MRDCWNPLFPKVVKTPSCGTGGTHLTSVAGHPLHTSSWPIQTIRVSHLEGSSSHPAVGWLRCAAKVSREPSSPAGPFSFYHTIPFTNLRPAGQLGPFSRIFDPEMYGGSGHRFIWSSWYLFRTCLTFGGLLLYLETLLPRTRTVARKWFHPRGW